MQSALSDSPADESVPLAEPEAASPSPLPILAGTPSRPLNQRPPVFGLLPGAMDALLQRMGWSKFRGKQIRDWVYQKLIADPAKMTNLSKPDQARLADEFRFAEASILSQQRSSDGTQKLLLGWPDHSVAECVIIPDGRRLTACISSQVGCPVGCKFCASGIGGVKGNLSSARIVEQIFTLNQLLQPAGHRIDRVVFMGMGEPLANYANVIEAIRILHDPQCFNLGARKMTVSTVGVPTKMRALADEGLPVNLAISLHSPIESLRRELIPWAEHFELDDILAAARYYFEKTGREITLEYILLAGVNDQTEHARKLARLCKTLRANINLIRYNEVEGLPFSRPAADDVFRFQAILRQEGINAHVRRSRGRDIDAACGQLRRRAAAPRAETRTGPIVTPAAHHV
jgi:23S rRNA (adenine2503-C2)-methyltransferase